MKVIRLRQPAGLDNLRLEEMDSPQAPGAGEIRVRLRASSINYHDYVVVTGGIRTPDGRIPLSDASGEVVAVGEGVHEFAVGDHVAASFFPNWLDGTPVPGGFRGVPGDGADGYAREEVTAPATNFTHAPKGYSHAEAATLTCAGATAWRALVVEGGIKAGDTVLVQGSGGVSTFALLFAKASGATVVATSSSDDKLQRLEALGADHLINYKKTPDWGKEVARIIPGGVDHVVEIGGAGTLPQSIMAARIGGHISLIGVLTGHQAPVQTVWIMSKQLRIIGITVGTRRAQQDMIRAIDANGVKPVISHHFPLENLADAFRLEESGGHFGKIVIDI